MVRRLFEPGLGLSEGEGGGTPATATIEPRAPMPPAKPTTPISATPNVRAAGTRRWPLDLVAILFFCLVALVATWPIALHPASTLPDLGDPLDSAWRLSWPVHQLLHDPRHLFDANTYYPFRTTYLFDELIVGVAIVVAPIVALTNNGVLAFNVALLIAFAMNGIGMYFLIRHLTGSQLAAIVGAVPFAVAPFRFAHIGHIGLSTAFWLPLALLFLDRTIIRPRWRDAILFGLCAAFQALSAQYYGFQLAIVIGLYLAWTIVRRPRLFFAWPLLLRLAFAVVLAEIVLLPIIAPYAGVKGTWAYSRGLEENELHSATASSFLAAQPDNPLGGRLASRVREALGVRTWNIWLYPGLGAVVLALAGLFRPRRRWLPPDWRETHGDAPRDLYGFFLGLGLFGAVMCLGPVLYLQEIDRARAVTRLMPYRAIFNLLPFFDAMRAPERFGNVLLLGLAVAVGFGVAGVLARIGPVQRVGWRSIVVGRVGRVALALVLLVCVGAEYLHAPLKLATVPAPPAVYGWLAAQPPGPVLELPLTIPPGEANREQLRQYWSTFHWQTRINGSSDIAPRASTALRQDLDTFPDARTLGILQALGVRYVVIHRAQYSRAAWEALAPRYAAYGATLQPRGEFGDDLALELQPDPRFAGLQRLIPPGATVFLGGNDPLDTDAYMATLAWLLDDGQRQLITKIIPTFGSRYDRPEAGERAEWVICYKGESPTAYSYPATMTVAYEDNVVRVYRR